MTTFDEREKAYEAKFAHDEDLKFKALARSTKLLGAWAAEHLGLIGADAEAYTKALLHEGLEKHGAADIAAKVVNDFKAKNVAVSEGDVRVKVIELTAQAVIQIETGH